MKRSLQVLLPLFLFFTVLFAAGPAKLMLIGKTGEVVLSQPTYFGEQLLSPGRYTLQHVQRRGANHQLDVMRLVRLSDLKGAAGVPAGNAPLGATRQGEVVCTVKTLGHAMPRTALVTNQNGDRTYVLEVFIRGENVVHILPSPQ